MKLQDEIDSINNIGKECFGIDDLIHDKHAINERRAVLKAYQCGRHQVKYDKQTIEVSR